MTFEIGRQFFQSEFGCQQQLDLWNVCIEQLEEVDQAREFVA